MLPNPVYGRRRRVAVWAGMFFTSLIVFPEGAWGAKPIDQGPSSEAGPDRAVSVGEVFTLYGSGGALDEEIVRYEWDFDGDGLAEETSAETGLVSYRFDLPGRYKCTLKVVDSAGDSITDYCTVTVGANGAHAKTLQQASPGTSVGDGVVRQYSVIINGGSESRYWRDVELTYRMLKEEYGFSDSSIYLLNYRGFDPSGENPDGMIDSGAYFDHVEQVFVELAGIVDGDDEVFLWLQDHGRGYTGMQSQGGIYYGYCDGRISVDPGDEADYSESDFKLRSIFTGGDYRCNHGLDVWKVRRKYRTSTKTHYYRNKYVSKLKKTFISEAGEKITDNDVFVERLVDYLEGDFDRDEYIDTSLGEVLDYDGDGNLPYDPVTGEFDEDDWGAIDRLEDDYARTNGGLPEDSWPIVLFDHNFEGKVCIDLNYAGGEPEIDGRDEDGEGLFDWMDVNRDGDADDVVSIDEGICLAMGTLYDDDLAGFADLLGDCKVTVVALPCFSGGFVEDMSGERRIVCTATIEEAVSWGDIFIRGFVAALHGQDEHGSVVDADVNGDGRVSMAEAFNYAAANDYSDEEPQYDDNGDGVSQTDPVGDGGDGALGAETYLLRAVQGDLDGDRVVDLVDLGRFAGWWGRTGCGVCGGADFSGDSAVSITDLRVIASCWLDGL